MFKKWLSILQQKLNAVSTRSRAETIPTFLEVFYTGKVRGQGVLQTRWGNVLQHFTISIDIQWTEEMADCSATYYFRTEAEVQTHNWQIVRQSKRRYRATTTNLVGTAKGYATEECVEWSYRAFIPVQGRAILFTIQDRLWRVSPQKAINRIQLKKWGWTVAEITIFLEK